MIHADVVFSSLTLTSNDTIMQPHYAHLERVINTYSPLSQQAWDAYLGCCKARTVVKGETLYSLGEKPNSFAFVHTGLFRAFVRGENGDEFNKNFFSEGRFPGSMSSLLTDENSDLEVQALEGSEIIEINHQQYRDVLFKFPDLMIFHIHYLEAHWLIEKEPREISLLQLEATERYLHFLQKFELILHRLPQFHIASYLGITPTQLSRIKKKIK